MKTPEAMSTEEKLAFSQAVTNAKLRLGRESDFGPAQAEADRALIMAADHITAIERRNENLALLRLHMDATLTRVAKFRDSLAQGIKAAKGGFLVGEVTAIESIYNDLQWALTPPEHKEEEPK